MTNAPVDTLLICANFFGYAREVQRGLVARGRNVLWFEDRPSTDDLTKAFIRIAPRLMRRVADDYFDGIIGRTRRYPIRDVLVIKGEALSVAAVKLTCSP